MPHLPAQPTLPMYQAYVAQLEIERGFSHQNALQKCLLLGEEMGELFKAVRKAENMGVDPASTVGPIGYELADVLIYVCAIANRCGVDLEQALREKEHINAQRTWARATSG